MNTIIETPSLTLSHEEVVLFLRLLGAPTMPGVGENPLAGLNPEQSQLILSSAERSLKARQIITVNPDKTITVERFALALVGPCVMPEFSVIATRTFKDTLPETLYFHAAQRMVIEHTITGPGLHTFTALLDRKVLLERLVNFLKIQTQSQVTSQVGILPVTLLRQVVKSTPNNGTNVNTLLQQSGVSTELSSVLSQDFTNLIANLGVVVIDHQAEGKEQSNGLALLQSESTFWQLDNNVPQTDQEMVSIRSISAADILTQLKSWIVNSTE